MADVGIEQENSTAPAPKKRVLPKRRYIKKEQVGSQEESNQVKREVEGSEQNPNSANATKKTHVKKERNPNNGDTGKKNIPKEKTIPARVKKENNTVPSKTINQGPVKMEDEKKTPEEKEEERRCVIEIFEEVIGIKQEFEEAKEERKKFFPPAVFHVYIISFQLLAVGFLVGGGGEGGEGERF
jgi:hypothetical protein